MNNINWWSLFTNPFYFALFYLAIANVMAFFLYGLDKLKAKRGWTRISEFTLFMVAVLGGSLGALVGISVWRHKTQHWKFTIGIPFVLVGQIALVVALYIAYRSYAMP